MWDGDRRLNLSSINKKANTHDPIQISKGRQRQGGHPTSVSTAFNAYLDMHSGAASYQELYELRCVPASTGGSVH